MKPLILSLQFLTRFYIPIAVDFSPANLRKSLFYFPWVGGLIGLCLYLPIYLISPRDLASLCSLFVWLALTGGLHLDGLSDMVDGFFSGREKDRILEIMKDSRVGAFGVVSLVFIILAKYTLLAKVPVQVYTYPLILGGARLANAFVIALAPSARKSGMGKMFQETKPLPYILATAVLFLALMAYINPLYLYCFLGQVILVAYTSYLSIQKIGGLTGDIYGANVELGEALGLFILGVAL